MMEGYFDDILEYFVIPVIMFVWIMHRTQQGQGTKIAVLEALLDRTKEGHDREIKEMRETVKHIFAKLDIIEQALRK
tara:strand:- start:4531 stop:4761 length:231 start_codon:yes stop_codon:yes gene_type:complete